MTYTNVYTDTDDLATVAPEAQDTALNLEDGILEWTNGPGYQRIIVASREPIVFEPFDSINYPVGTFVGGDQRIVFRGKGNSVNMNVIVDMSELWYFRLYAFNGSATNEKYNREELVIAGSAEGSFDYTLDETFE